MLLSYTAQKSEAKTSHRKRFRDLVNPDLHHRELRETKALLRGWYDEGIRNIHQIRLAVAGVFAKLGLKRSLAVSVLRSSFLNGDYWRDAKKAVKSTYDRHDNDEEISGSTALRYLLGYKRYELFLETMASELVASDGSACPVIKIKRRLVVADGYPLEGMRDIFRDALPQLKYMGASKKHLGRLASQTSCKTYESGYYNYGELKFRTKHRCWRKGCGECRGTYWPIGRQIVDDQIKAAGVDKITVARWPVAHPKDMEPIKRRVWAKRPPGADILAYTDFVEEEIVFVGAGDDIYEIAKVFGLGVEVYDRLGFMSEIFNTWASSLSDRIRGHIAKPNFVEALFNDPWLKGQYHTYSGPRGHSSVFTPPSDEEVRKIIKEEAIAARQAAGNWVIHDFEPEAKQVLTADGYNFEFRHKNSATGREIGSTAEPLPPWEIRLLELASWDDPYRLGDIHVNTRMKERHRQLE